MKLGVCALALAFAAVALPAARGEVVGFEEAELSASNGGTNDRFGSSVSISGDTAVVGSPGAEAAYVYVHSGTTWVQQGLLVPGDGAEGFGGSVSIAGGTIVVGARFDDDSGHASGSAYVYVQSSGVWSQQAKLTAADAVQDDEFGSAVSISGDTVVVGAHGDEDSGPLSGSVYVFVRAFGSWSQQAELSANDGDPDFGSSVSIGGDTVVVGAPEGNGGPGSAYVFVRVFGAWSQQARLVAGDGSPGDLFGSDCSISGGTAVVGAMLHHHAGVSDSGAAYVFVRSSGSWGQQGKLTANAPGVQDHFGESVAISGHTVLAGARNDDDGGQSSGCAYVFERGGSTWSRQGKVTASDAAAWDRFGSSVAISGDTAVVGAPDTGAAVGSAYAFGPNGSETCVFATPISGEGAFGFDNIGATTDGLTHLNCFGGFAQVPSDVWYRWTAPCSADVTIATCATTSLDTRLVVYQGPNCPVLTSSLACNDDACGPQSQVTFAAGAGSEYLIRLGLSSPNDAQGRGRFTISAGCGGGCPSQTAASGPSGFSPLDAARALYRLRRFRDRVLRPSPIGRRWIGLYYEHAEAMSRILRADPALRRRAAALVAVVSPGLDALAEGGATPNRIPDHALALLDAVLRGLEGADGEGELARTLRAERERLDIARLCGATYAQAWRRIEAEPGERR